MKMTSEQYLKAPLNGLLHEIKDDMVEGRFRDESSLLKILSLCEKSIPDFSCSNQDETFL